MCLIRRRAARLDVETEVDVDEELEAAGSRERKDSTKGDNKMAMLCLGFTRWKVGDHLLTLTSRRLEANYYKCASKCSQANVSSFGIQAQILRF